MKLFIKKLFLFLIIITVLQNKGNCQVREVLDALKPTKAFEGTPILKKGSHVLQAGIGIGSNLLSVAGIENTITNALGISTSGVTSSSKIGPFSLAYEYLIKDNLGLGIGFSYAEATQSINTPATTNLLGLITLPAVSLNTKLQSTTILLSTTYHLYTTDKFDPYTKVSIGATLWKGTNTDAKGNDIGTFPTLPAPIAYNALVGLRYFAGKSVGLYGELSYSNLKFVANAGIAFKLH
jgi:hypothetical protein